MDAELFNQITGVHQKNIGKEADLRKIIVMAKSSDFPIYSLLMIIKPSKNNKLNNANLDGWVSDNREMELDELKKERKSLEVEKELSKKDGRSIEKKKKILVAGLISLSVLISLILFQFVVSERDSNSIKEALIKERKLDRSEEDSKLQKIKVNQVSISPYQYTVQDPDGWSNVRREPKGSIIARVYEGTRFEVLDDSNKWVKVKLQDGTIGYIHHSRVVKINP